MKFLISIYLLLITNNLYPTKMKITNDAATSYPRLQDMVDFYNQKADGPIFWEHSVEKNLSITAAKPNVLSWEFKVEEFHCNQ